MEAIGKNGKVAFDGRALTITRDNLMGRVNVGRGEKVIPLRSVGAVQLVRPSMMTKGFWQVSIAGEVQRSRRVVDVTNENTVVIGKSQVADFEALSAAVNEALVSL